MRVLSIVLVACVALLGCQGSCLKSKSRGASNGETKRAPRVLAPTKRNVAQVFAGVGQMRLVGQGAGVEISAANEAASAVEAGAWIDVPDAAELAMVFPDRSEIHAEPTARLCIERFENLYIVIVARGIVALTRPPGARASDEVLLVAPEAAVWIERDEAGVVAVDATHGRSLASSFRGDVDAVLHETPFERRRVVLPTEGMIESTSTVVRIVSSRRHEIIAEIDGLFHSHGPPPRAWDLEALSGAIGSALDQLGAANRAYDDAAKIAAHSELALSLGFALAAAGAKDDAAIAALRHRRMSALLLLGVAP